MTAPQCDRFEFWIAKYDRLIHKLIRRNARFFRTREEAEDAYADVIALAAKRFPDFDEAKGGFGTWIGYVVTSVHRFRRRDLARPKPTVLLESPEVVRQMENLTAPFDDAPFFGIDELGIEMFDLDREMFIMHTELGYTQAEIAERFGVSQSRVAQRIERVREAGRKALVAA